MKSPDLDRARSEKLVSLPVFLKEYNTGLPASFPMASAELLRDFKKSHAELFKHSGQWSLATHRKKVMDWLPAHVRISADLAVNRV